MPGAARRRREELGGVPAPGLAGSLAALLPSSLGFAASAGLVPEGASPRRRGWAKEDSRTSPTRCHDRRQASPGASGGRRCGPPSCPEAADGRRRAGAPEPPAAFLAAVESVRRTETPDPPGDSAGVRALDGAVASLGEPRESNSRWLRRVARAPAPDAEARWGGARPQRARRTPRRSRPQPWCGAAGEGWGQAGRAGLWADVVHPPAGPVDCRDRSDGRKTG